MLYIPTLVLLDQRFVYFIVTNAELILLRYILCKQENTYQAILITDGTYTYTVFTYDCNLAEWGTSVTIGFNAAGEVFENNEYTTYDIACSNPFSNLINVIYRLSEENPEYILPGI